MRLSGLFIIALFFSPIAQADPMLSPAEYAEAARDDGTRVDEAPRGVSIGETMGQGLISHYCLPCAPPWWLILAATVGGIILGWSLAPRQKKKEKNP